MGSNMGISYCSPNTSLPNTNLYYLLGLQHFKVTLKTPLTLLAHSKYHPTNTTLKTALQNLLLLPRLAYLLLLHHHHTTPSVDKKPIPALRAAHRHVIHKRPSFMEMRRMYELRVHKNK